MSSPKPISPEIGIAVVQQHHAGPGPPARPALFQAEVWGPRPTDPSPLDAADPSLEEVSLSEALAWSRERAQVVVLCVYDDSGRDRWFSAGSMPAAQAAHVPAMAELTHVTIEPWTGDDPG